MSFSAPPEFRYFSIPLDNSSPYVKQDISFLKTKCKVSCMVWLPSVRLQSQARLTQKPILLLDTAPPYNIDGTGVAQKLLEPWEQCPDTGYSVEP